MTEYQTMQWKFPQITHCPRLNCKQTFTSRNEAIRHYRTMHSIYDVLCQECEQIISLTGTHNLMNHYKRKHPDIQPPAKMFENKVLNYQLTITCRFNKFQCLFSDRLHAPFAIKYCHLHNCAFIWKRSTNRTRKMTHKKTLNPLRRTLEHSSANLHCKQKQYLNQP